MLSEEEIAMIHAARELSGVYDEDNAPADPVATPKQFAALMKVAAGRNRLIAGKGLRSCSYLRLLSDHRVTTV